MASLHAVVVSPACTVSSSVREVIHCMMGSAMASLHAVVMSPACAAGSSVEGLEDCMLGSAMMLPHAALVCWRHWRHCSHGVCYPACPVDRQYFGTTPQGQMKGQAAHRSCMGLAFTFICSQAG